MLNTRDLHFNLLVRVNAKRALENNHILEYIRSNYEQQLVLKAQRTTLVIAITNRDISRLYMLVDVSGYSESI